MTDVFLHAANPVFVVDGSVQGALARDCRHLEIREATDGLRTLTLALTALAPDASGAQERVRYLDGELLDFGSELEVSMGPPGTDEVLFTGRVSAIEVAWREATDPEVTVFAEDALMDLRMTRRCRTWEGMSDSDIAGQLAAEHGLQGAASAEGPTYDVVQQWNVSDLAFLRERAARVDAEVWLADGALHFAARGQRELPAVPTLVRGGNLIEVRLRADLAHQRSSVTVSGYDAQRRAAAESRADGTTLQREAAGGRTGPAVLDRAFGARDSHRVMHVPLDQVEADAWADGEMLRRGRRFVVADGVASGTPALRVGSSLTLDRVAEPFGGDGWVVTSMCHSFDLTRGFRTAFRAERPFLRTG